ncbi:MAG: DUF47 family protein [Pseudomonadota bacterium]
MFARFMPKEVKFFDLFNAHAQEITQGAALLSQLLDAMNNHPEQVQHLADAIDAAESRADRITHDTVALLHKTFITPLDRDEIHDLISRLDDVMDTIQDVAQTVTMYDIRRAPPETLQLAAIIVECVKYMVQGVGMLSNMKNGQAILATCRELDRLEGEADHVLRQALSRLFREDIDVRDLIKLKAIYVLLETVTDHADDVGNILQAIVLENA